MTQALWTPSPDRIAQAAITRFAAEAGRRFGRHLPDYKSLHDWSAQRPDQFWDMMWDWANIRGDKGAIVAQNLDKMPGAAWFPEAKLNFAENLLGRKDEAQAIQFWGEDKVRRSLSWRQLYDQVSRMMAAMKAAGIGPGDRVAAYLPNMPEAPIAMLATAGLGAIWSSASPDFGVQGVLDRFGQTQPKILIGVDGYHYNGKTHDCLGKLKEIAAGLPTLEKLIIVPYASAAPDLSGLANAQLFADFLAPFVAQPIVFERFAFDHPLYILFSSGTTGAPKCICHGAGGTLLQHMKEHLLHCDIRPNDRVFYFTTLGWMMWNWLMTALASEATLMLYDGSPFYPSGNVLFDYAETEKFTFFGTSAKWIDAVLKAGLEPINTHDLSAVRLITSTGSPLSPEGFEFVYRSIKQEVCLSSISGGTDIVSCFMLGNPALPVHRGEIQCLGLGMKVEVYDENAKPIYGEKGELVCTKPFPSMPVGFWNDADGQKYHNAYFAKYPNVWCHGDWIEITPSGGVVVFGRSDATLNPGGVRIGTAEIYRQVEQLHEVVESLVIGQDWDNDVRVVLFVRLRDGIMLSDDLQAAIKKRIRDNCTPRHVPARIVQVDDIPRTKSGKIVELAVRDVVHGRSVKNIEALANPEALELFKDRSELKG
ncbi:Acetyl-coenzyme A synthetase 1 [Rhodospirillaceae bacterium LM-1]|nr:Acetyl-coenzyme A synthetase 1 [Rhodospirillaceae bacterium LM-1]